MTPMPWKPTWWKDETHGTAWERVREAMERDWVQTKKDLSISTGHEVNQGVGDTVKQMAGKEAIPASDKPNPPQVIGDLRDVDMPMSYGFAARTQYGTLHPTWSGELEGKLRREWDGGADKLGRDWRAVREHVRYGYEYKPH